MAQRTLESVAGRARGLFLRPDNATLTAQALTPAQVALAARYRAAAQRRTAVADDLREGHNAVAALRLYREGFQLLVATIAVSHDDAQADSQAGSNDQRDPDAFAGPAAIAALRTLAGAGRIPPLPDAVEQAGLLLSAPELLAFDGDATDDVLIKRDAAAAAVKWLRRLAEPPVLRRTRLRWPAVAGLAALVLAGVIAARVMTSQPANLALYRPVTASSRHPHSTAPADNSGLVNGQVEPTYGIHTAPKNAWVMVELDGVHAIDTVKVYNRGDGWFDEGLPMTLELSEDGRTFAAVDTRTTHFSSTAPWVFQAGGRRARAVRIRSATYISLAELEVYEKH